MLSSRKDFHLEQFKQTELSVADIVYYWDPTNLMNFKNFKVDIFILFLFYLPLRTKFPVTILHLIFPYLNIFDNCESSTANSFLPVVNFNNIKELSWKPVPGLQNYDGANRFYRKFFM